MKIEILGTGCYDCLRLELLVADVLNSLGITGAEVVRVDDERRIARCTSLDAVPGLMINGRLVSERGVPDRATLTAWLSQARDMETTAGSGRQ
jgi:hypothetical protein